MKWSSVEDSYSNIVSFVWLAVYLFLFFKIPLMYFTFRANFRHEHIENSRFKIFIEGFRFDKKISVFDHSVFMIRRAVLVFILIFSWNHGFLQAILFLIACLAVLVWKIVLRPYEETLYNIQDVIYECILCSMIGCFIGFKDPESELKEEGKFHILGIVCSSLVVSLILVNFIFSILMIIKQWVAHFKLRKMVKVKATSKSFSIDSIQKNVVIDFGEKQIHSDITMVAH